MELWTKEHALLLVPAYIVMLIISIILAHFLKDKDEKYKMLPIKIIAVILVVLEIAKQIYNLASPDGYRLKVLPLHFCSLAVYFLPLFAFYKGKFKQNIASFTFMCCAMIMVFMLVYPTLIFGRSSIRNYFSVFNSFHTVTFHILVCFAFMLIVALKLYDYDTKRDMKIIILWFTIFCVISAGMSQILKTNFNNFYNSSIKPVESFRLNMIEQMGWWGQLIYVLLMYIANIAFALMCYWIVRGAIALVNKICTKIKGTRENKIATK